MCCMAVEETTRICLNFKCLLEDIPERIKVLSSKQSEYDKKISDLLHDIELSKTYDTRTGMLDAQKLRRILKERREIKDELAILTSINMRISKSGLKRNLNAIIGRVEKLDKRIYTNRFSQAN